MTPKFVTIGGKRWRFVWQPVSPYDGQCDSPTNTNKAIRVAAKLQRRPYRLLEVAIHEALHAADWTKDDADWVEPIAEDIARFLWALGYRRIQDDADKTKGG